MSALPTPLQSKLNQAAESERKATEARVEEERVSLTTSIEDSLEAGLSVDRIKQSLQKRAFVIDFNYAPIKRRPGGIRSLVKQFSEAVTLLLATASPYDEVIVKHTSTSVLTLTLTLTLIGGDCEAHEPRWSCHRLRTGREPILEAEETSVNLAPTLTLTLTLIEAEKSRNPDDCLRGHCGSLGWLHDGVCRR